MPAFDDLIKYLNALNISIVLAACIVVFIFCILNIDKLLRFKEIIAGLFVTISSSARKTKISSSIRAKTMKATKMFQSDGLSILPNDLKIEWVKNENRDTFLKDNRLIIRMSQKSNPHENFVNAILEFVSVGLLYKERAYMDNKVMKAADISVIQKLLLSASIDSLTYFNNRILTEIITEDNELTDLITEIAAIDGNGMFINILLNEYMKVGNKIFPQPPDPCLIAESKEFLRYLYNISMGLCITFDDFIFNREYFKTCVLLAARTETLERRGVTPYLKNITNYINQGIETIYIFGLGRKVDVAKLIAKEASENNFEIRGTKTHYYSHRALHNTKRISGVCIEITVFKE